MLDLGRYEYHDDDKNSHKFWSCHFNERHKTYTTSWGRVGARAQIKQGLTEAEVNKKIAEKVSKGYVKVHDDSSRKRTVRSESSKGYVKVHDDSSRKRTEIRSKLKRNPKPKPVETPSEHFMDQLRRLGDE